MIDLIISVISSISFGYIPRGLPRLLALKQDGPQENLPSIPRRLASGIGKFSSAYFIPAKSFEFSYNFSKKEDREFLADCLRNDIAIEKIILKYCSFDDV